MTAQPQVVLDLRRDKAKGLQDLPREQYVAAMLGGGLSILTVLDPSICSTNWSANHFTTMASYFFMARALSVGALRYYKTWADICS